MPVSSTAARRLGLLLRVLRLRAGKDQAELAKAIGISQPTVSRWERGSSCPDLAQAELWLNACAKVAGPATMAQARSAVRSVLAAEANGGEAERARIDEALWAVLGERELVSEAAVPYFADVAAGIGEAQEQLSQPKSELCVPREVLRRDPGCYAMRVSGDSMTPQLLDGDIVIVSPAAPLVDGCTVAAYVEPDGDVVKLYRRLPGGAALLQPANPSYPTVVLTPESERHGRLWGRVVLVQREL